MKRHLSFVGLATLLFVATACGDAVLTREPVARPGSPDRSRLAESGRAAQASLDDLPLTFIENRGQVDPSVDYYVQGAGASLSFGAGAVGLSLPDRNGTSQRWGLELGFLDADDVNPLGRGRGPSLVSYFKGEPEDWVTGLPTYSRLVYRDLWPGIDLVYSGTTSRLKYSFVVQPGADPADIRLKWRGATGVHINAGGELEVSSPGGGFIDQAPVSWQRVEGDRQAIATSFRAGPGPVYGFDVGAHDPGRPLVIDPAVLLYAGYIGGADNERAVAIAVDGGGSAYVTGRTNSPEATFPVKVGPDLTYNTGEDVFVAKVNPAGTGLDYAGYIGGDDDEFGQGIDVDGSGAAYVTGRTDSTQNENFPVDVGPDLLHNGNFDAFVAKVSPAGTDLVYSGYIGGNLFDDGLDVEVDGAGAAYVTGYTDSSQATFPVEVGPDLEYNMGGDAFVAKVNPSGADLSYAGYIGGDQNDGATGVAVDGAGNAYVVGTTDSAQATFPDEVGPDSTYNMGGDAFAAKVNPSGAGLAYAGYIGGDQDDDAYAVAVDGTGAAYVTGDTNSPQATFPETVGPDLTYGMGGDGFVARVNPSGAGLDYAGYMGGSDDDHSRGVSVDPAGSAYMVGYTESSEAEAFPVKLGPDLTYNGGTTDAFVAKVNPSGADLGYAGYVGGDMNDRGNGAAVDLGGNAYVAGDTVSPEATFPDVVGPDLTFNGMTDAFVSKVETTETCKGKPVTRLGTGGNDVVSGTSGADVVKALAGNDVVQVVGGTDLVCAGEGNDKANGGGGRDTLLGENGKDRLRGAGGKDKLKGGPKKDTCIGGPGKDKAPKCEKVKSVP